MAFFNLFGGPRGSGMDFEGVTGRPALTDPQMAGLLSLASGLFKAGQPSLMPTGLGSALGSGLQGGIQGYQQAQLSALQRQKLEQEAKMMELHGKLYGAQADKTAADAARQARLAQIMNGGMEAPPQVGLSDNAAASMGAPWAAASGLPQQVNPLDGFKARASLLAKEGFLTEANQVAELVKKLQPDLEFKDGIWYNKADGKPVAGGAGINQQGFGYQTQVGPNGISVGPLAGAASLYGQQQDITNESGARYDLRTVPATGPNTPPRFASRLELLGGSRTAPAVPAAPGVAPKPGAAVAPSNAAGMSPAQEEALANSRTQNTKIAENYGKIYNDLQNASMANPSKIAKTKRIGTLLGDFEGGKFSVTGLDIARAANSAGFKLDSKLSNKEAAESLTNEVALELRSTADGGGMPGAMSDADRQFLRNMTPQMAQSADGRKTIIESRVKVMERENQVADMARKYKRKYNKLDEDFFTQLQEWSNRNPLFKAK
jgi:hypothetical protein